MNVAIQTRALHKRFGQHTALHGLDLTVQPGTVFGLIGPNGAGKTTALRTLLDVIRPTSGSVSVLGEDPRHGGAALRRRPGDRAPAAGVLRRGLRPRPARRRG
jgi:ABC-2 type transport system ATP-binding protein